jgi:hypothetical protein
MYYNCIESCVRSSIESFILFFYSVDGTAYLIWRLGSLQQAAECNVAAESNFQIHLYSNFKS